MRLTEWTKNRETGEFVPSTSGNHAGRALLSGNPAQGLPFAQHQQGAEEEGNLQVINVSFRVRPEGDGGVRRQAVAKRLPPGTKAGISIASTTCWCRGEAEIIGRRKKGQGDRAAVCVRSATAGERYNKVVDIWGKAGDEVSKVMMAQLAKRKTIDRHGKEVDQESFNSIYHDGRLRRPRFGSADPPAGRHARPDGQARRLHHRDADHGQLPRRPERAAVLHLHHGARKGLADTALKTAKPGYLTRRLVDDVTQDPGGDREIAARTHDGSLMRAIVEGGEVIDRCATAYPGPRLPDDVLHPRTMLVTAGAGRREMLARRQEALEDLAGVDEVKVRTALTCEDRLA